MDTLSRAQQIARRWPVFFCHDDKSPACHGGFYAASRDPVALARLWRRSPGPLVAVRTGDGLAVLDIDPAGWDWFQRNHNRLPRTLTVATRRDPGRHLYFAHPDLPTSAGRIAPGIDTRGRAGYVIAWAVHGYPILDRSPIAEWPAWLSEELERRPDPAVRDSAPALKTTLQGGFSPRYRVIIARLLAPVSAAQAGQKRDALLRAAYTLGGYLDDAGLSESDAMTLLLDALPQADVLDWDQAERAARDGLRAGQAHPMALPDRPYSREAAA